jgi:high-affinity nickel permease
MMREGKRPLAVGFFFSLGHSTVVAAASVLIARRHSRTEIDVPDRVLPEFTSR